MANLGTRTVTLLKDTNGLKAGETISATVWLNLDSYTDCAETRGPLGTIPLGRITDGGWKYADPKHCPHKVNEWDEAGETLTCTHCGLDVT